MVHDDIRHALLNISRSRYLLGYLWRPQHASFLNAFLFSPSALRSTSNQFYVCKRRDELLMKQIKYTEY